MFVCMIVGLSVGTCIIEIYLYSLIKLLVFFTERFSFHQETHLVLWLISSWLWPNELLWMLVQIWNSVIWMFCEQKLVGIWKGKIGTYLLWSKLGNEQVFACPTGSSNTGKLWVTIYPKWMCHIKLLYEMSVYGIHPLRTTGAVSLDFCHMSRGHWRG